MKTKRILFFLFLPLLLDVLIVGCCDCPTPEYFNYSNCTLSLQNLDNAGLKPLIAAGDTILKEAYGIQLTIERSEDICSHQNLPFFSSSVYAFGCHCSPALTITPQDSATSIQIITINPFDQNHGAGTDISAYFKTEGFIDMNEFLTEFNRQQYEPESRTKFHINFLLMTPPPISGNHQLELIINFADGRTLKDTTTIVYLR
ncbi:DUF5034 domain-containing protein [Owenweeksia hongkongensis]|uniref:DUF5034 domain-containing protein n=1 Tax=Owenweeksia hongkongensis TaxID=253245 RepID=UPI003A929CF7